MKRHRFRVSASDRGSPKPLSGSALVDVTVEDANDNRPKFVKDEYMVKLSDKAQRGQFVAQVKAVDEDEVGSLSYSVVGGTGHQFFSVEANSGTITLVNLHNFGTQSSKYHLNVSVSDGVYSSNAMVKVILSSANANAPVFEKAIYEVDYAENQAAGVLVARVHAKDADRYDEVVYSMQSETAIQMFSLDEKSGELWSKKSFDREERSSYHIPLVATDKGGRSGFASLRIDIVDVNDNAPKFELSEYKANVHANLTVGSALLRVRARDADEFGGPNSDLTYTIHEKEDSGINQVFEVDPSKGHIRLKSSIKTKENQVYQFFVRASDRSTTNPLHSDVPVEVYIMSSLDFPPMFDRRDSQFYVSENSPLGRLVVQLHARVPPSGDESENSEVENEIKYSIVSTEYMAVDGDDSEETLFQV